MLEEYLKKTEPEYYPPVENLLDLIYEHYTENNPVEKNTDAGKAAKAKEKELEEWLRGLDANNPFPDNLSASRQTPHCTPVYPAVFFAELSFLLSFIRFIALTYG